MTKKYEYQIIAVSTTNYAHKDPLVDLMDRINDWADDGWRCVSSYYSTSEPAYIAIMERGKENE